MNEIVFENSRAVPVIDLTCQPSSNTIDNLANQIAPHLPTQHPVLLLIGGAGNMDRETFVKLAPLFDSVLVPWCERHRITVVDGGTRAGVMQLMGESHARKHATFPLIGVVPKYSVCLPNPQVTAAESISLEPNHTHFVMTEDQDWLQQSQTLSQITTIIARCSPSVTLLINGGQVTRHDALLSQAAKRSVIALDGSGRFADEFCQMVYAGWFHEIAHTPTNYGVAIDDHQRLIDLLERCLGVT